MGRSDDLWNRADRMAWEEELLPPGDLLAAAAREFRRVAAPLQVIHGDLLGNVLFEPGSAPAIIDWAPYWRPAGLGLAIAAVDAACWHGWPSDRLNELGAGIAFWGQLLIRALAFRVATQVNHDRWDADMEARHAPVLDAAIAAAQMDGASGDPRRD